MLVSPGGKKDVPRYCNALEDEEEVEEEDTENMGSRSSPPPAVPGTEMSRGEVAATQGKGRLGAPNLVAAQRS
jgi:hypothetical protein